MGKASPGSRARSRSSRAAGRAGPARPRWWRSSAQAPQLVDVERKAAAEEGDDQAEPDDDLAGGDDHHDDREDLPLLIADHAAEGDQGEVAGVQHQLQAEQDHDRAAADQQAHRAGGEEQAGEDDVPLDAHPDPPSRLPPASTTAPTAASRSRIEEASKGMRNFSSRRVPIEAGSPKPGSTSGPVPPSASSEEASTAIASSTKRAMPSRGARKRWPGIGSQADSSAPPT